MLAKLLRFANRGRNIHSTLDHEAFKMLPFEYSWNNLVKSYDLRTWYVDNAVDDKQRFRYTLELEELHNELNYLFIRTLFTFLFYGFYFFVFTPGNYDWHENWDPKHDLKLYGELEDGGDEGGDDD